MSQLFGDPNGVYAQVIADSWNDRWNSRLVTMEVQCHRFVLAEFNTHRAFSRNSASSRAIPLPKQIKRMEEMGLAFPLSWPQEKSGMQGGEELSEEALEVTKEAWTAMAAASMNMAKHLHEVGLHKSVVNRLLEPFMWHKIIVSATEWDNFFKQRCSPLAQPEIRAVAERMEEALANSQPDGMNDRNKGWHTPYIGEEDREQLMLNELIQVSAARCARVSYLTHDGKRDPNEDLKLFHRLRQAEPPHWSPLEHVAAPAHEDELKFGNFRGWMQLRHIEENY